MTPMAQESGYRDELPQLSGELFLTDGGIETTLIFHRGSICPSSPRSTCSRTTRGRRSCGGYYVPYLELAKRNGGGFVLESPTWRASPRWAAEIGYGAGGPRWR